LAVGSQEVNPFVGAERRQVNARVLVPIWERVGELVEDLEQASYPTSRVEVLHALIFLRLPQERPEAIEMLRQWRAVLNAPPPPR